jgi:glycosyltransferase involved in cell wall biosynthesis
VLCSTFIVHHIYHHLHQLMNYCIEDAHGTLCGTSKITFMLNQGSLMKVSVIVATRNRAHAIGPCLDSIATAFAEASPLDAEIVVVDNGSSDNTAEIIKAWATATRVSVQLLKEPKAGHARAQNHALRFAHGQLLAFTDDDCRLHPQYVKDLLRHDDEDRGLVLRGGRIELGDPTDLPLTINTSPTLMRWTLTMSSARHHRIPGYLNGCNMVMRRALLDQIGLFDEAFGPGSYIGSGEDSDLMFRAYLAGATLEYVPDMTVFHYHGRKTPEAGRKLMRRYTMANGAMLARYQFTHPDLCRVFYQDLRHTLRSLISGRNTLAPEIHFSNTDMVVYSALGFIKYTLMRKHSLPRLSESVN